MPTPVSTRRCWSAGHDNLSSIVATGEGRRGSAASRQVE